MKEIAIDRRRMHKSGIISISAFAVQLFFILKKNPTLPLALGTLLFCGVLWIINCLYCKM